ncbi:MAG: hypothetical protein Q4E75_05775 [bacterium]|nr:hypothetical protein [bacterium]
MNKKVTIILVIILIIILGIVGIKSLNDKKTDNKEVKAEQTNKQAMNAVFVNENTKLQLYQDGTFNYNNNGVVKLGNYMINNNNVVLNIVYKLEENNLVPITEVRNFVSDSATVSLISYTDSNSIESIKFVNDQVDIVDSLSYILSKKND